ncbi:MAG: hypothetical protein QGH40_10575 [bacterium]|nr:hypothetical protein [bacterium]
MSIWLGEDVARYIERPPGVKINPNGVDLRVSEIWRIPDDGTVTVHGKTREIHPPKEKVEPSENGFFHLPRGTYEIRVANRVTVPSTAAGFLFPRTTFNRLGVMKSETGVWDSGYSGYGTQTVRVTVKELKVHRDEYWFQLVFMDTTGTATKLYDGHWQGEKPE